MTIAAGTRLGSYEVVAQIGAGGMGEVYQAHDTKLGRDVAIKVLPEAFAHDAERLARFQREAKMLAQLNHANIATIYGLEHSSDTHYLVMELVTGDTLAERVKRDGAVPVEDALAIAKQIAEALEAAHEKSIIHRDLKPANVKVTPEDKVKVLDFGLAKAFAGETETTDFNNSPTLSQAATMQGVILGTAAYMSPEQARGKTIDKRTDIWAFGCVLYELLTGKQAFSGEDVTEILAAVVKSEPDWSRLPELSPSTIKTLLRHCLRKDKRQRMPDVAAVRIVIEDVLTGAATADAIPTARGRQQFGWIPTAMAAALLFLLAALSFVHFRETPPSEQRAARFEVPSPTPRVGPFTLSPDGRYLAMSGSGRNRLWVRPIDSLEARELPGTEGATYPFWSPESSYIGFFADGKLKKIALAGGEAQILCDAAGSAGGSWGPNGTILFPLSSATSYSRVLGRVSAAGGVPSPVTKVAVQGDNHKYPEFLPGGRRFLYLLVSENTEKAGIYVGSLDGAPPKRLLADQSSATYVPASALARDGFVLFRHGTTLMALPFNSENLQATGDMFPLAQQIGIAGNAAHAGFSVSANGTLAYLSASGAQQHELAFLDRSGKRLSALAKTGSFRTAAISPDDRTVAVSINDSQAGTTDIWLADVARNTISRFTSVTGAGSIASFPAWSPDGKRIAFSIRLPNAVQRNLYWKAANGIGQPELLLHGTGGDLAPYAWSQDGKFIVYAESGSETKRDIWLLPLEGDRKPVPYLNTAADEDFPQFSPDSRWMAYASDESGTAQVYIQAVPQNGTRVQVSTAGGSQPRWRGDDKELFYVSADQKMMAAPIQESNASIEAGTPMALFEGAPETIAETFKYQPTADGQRFLMIVPSNEGASPRLTVMLNWRAHSSK
jgi:serine/threonine protein kinase/Tol biopolymer transport system component